MAFRVGQKVVCITNYHKACQMYGVDPYPRQGRIYTIRDIDARGSNGVGLRLEEIHSAPMLHILNGKPVVCETAFVATGFRPVVERKTDISTFTALLKPNKRERVAD